MEKLKSAFMALLELLPECGCTPDALCRAALHFDVSPEEVYRAAHELPDNFDLQYLGVRLLLSLCLEEFCLLYNEEEKELCEVSVPSPLPMILALQEESAELRFTTGAFFAQIVLRGILLKKDPLELTSCAKRHCGLNNMRRRLLCEVRPRFLLQLGILCDECVKCTETSPEITTVSASLPKGVKSGDRYLTEFMRDYINRTRAALGIEADKTSEARALALYARLVNAESKLLALNGRPERRPLGGNSLALAQSVQLMTALGFERFVSAVETLTCELETAPADSSVRIYCFYVPFLQPEIDRRCRQNGVRLLGNAAFLYSEPSLSLLDPVGLSAAWTGGLAVRSDLQTECAMIARAMKQCGCRVYLTGMFGFDRRMGSAVPMQAHILKERYGIVTKLLDSDFWCENAMYGSTIEKVDNICAALTAAR